MKYTIDGFIGAYAGFRHRLQKDTTWRQVPKDWKIQDGDVIFGDVVQARAGIPNNATLSLGGNLYRVNPSPVNMSNPNVFVHPVAHHQARPKLFTRDEVRGVIQESDDDHNNWVAVSVDGRVFMITDDLHATRLSKPVAVYHEGFMVGSGYVGPSAADAKSFVDGVYMALLDGWHVHLCTGELDQFADMEPTISEGSLLEKIETEYTRMGI